MKLRYLTAAAIVFSGAAFAQDATVVAPTPVKLELSLTPGQVRAFKITIDQKGSMTLPGSGQNMPLNTGITAFAKLIVDKQNPDGTWAARYRIGGMKFLMNGAPMTVPGSSDSMVIKGTISKNGSFTPVDDVSKLGGGMGVGMSAGQTMNNVLGNLMNLPTKSVVVGDTWTDNTPLPYDTTGKSILTVNSKIAGIDILNGDQIVNISRQIEGPLNMALTAPMPMNITGTIKGTGLSRVSAKTGSPIDDVSTQHIVMTITGTNPSGNGEEMNISLVMDVTSKIESQVLPKTTVKPAAKTPAKAPVKKPVKK